MSLLAAAALALAAPAAVPPAAPVAAEAPEPARLAAARALIASMMPPDKSRQMIRDMMAPTMANVRQAMEQNGELTALFSDRPEAKAKFTAFLDRQMERTMTQVTASLPALMDAMATAYARRFSVAQLDEVRLFYATPTGRAFVDQMPAVMADPAIGEVQRRMMAGAMTNLQAEIQAFASEMAALEKTP